MLLSTNIIYVWLITLSRYKSLNYDIILNINDYKKANEFIYKKHKNAFLLRRAILKLIISQYTDIPALKINILYTKNSKPYINSTLHFNTSYTDQHLTIGLSSNNIGIDIEKSAGLSISNDLIELFMSKNEIATYTNLKEHKQKDYLYAIWSAKEAVMKLLGTGFLMDPKDITVDLHNKKANIKNTKNSIYLYKKQGVYIATNIHTEKIIVLDSFLHIRN